MNVFVKLEVKPTFNHFQIDDEIIWVIDESKNLKAALLRPEEGRKGPLIRVTGEEDIPSNVLQDLREIENGRLPDRSPMPDKSLGIVDSDRNIKEKLSLHVDYLHPETADWWMQNQRKYRLIAENLARALIFRHDIDAPNNAVPYASIQWSTDRETWFQRPTELSLRVAFNEVKQLKSSTHKEIVTLAASGVPEPLPHELLREAKSLGSYPRSQLLIMVAALETAVKRCISTLAPDTSWLCENTASPDILKLLWQYLPTLKPLPNRLGPVIPSKAFRKDIQIAIEARNKLVHGGMLEDRHKKCLRSLDTLQEQVADIIWILEVNNGFDWPASHLRFETRKEITEQVKELRLKAGLPLDPAD